MSRRTDRVASLIRAELAELVLRRLKDPRIGFVTITHVDIAPDLKSARVFFSVLGQGKENAAAGEGLEHAAGFLQHEIAVALKLRFTPKLTFHLDDTLEESLRIQQVLQKLKEDQSRK